MNPLGPLLRLLLSSARVPHLSMAKPTRQALNPSASRKRDPDTLTP